MQPPDVMSSTCYAVSSSVQKGQRADTGNRSLCEGLEAGSWVPELSSVLPPELSRWERVVSSWLLLFGQCHLILCFLVEEGNGSLNSELLWHSLSWLVEAWPSLVSVLPAGHLPVKKKKKINNAYTWHSLKDMFAFKLFLLYSGSYLACVQLTWLI